MTNLYAANGNMIKNEKNFADRIVWVLTVALLALFSINSFNVYGRYFLLLVTALVIFFDFINTKGNIYIKFLPMHYFFFGFSAFCYLSSLWATNSGESIAKGTTILEIALFATVFYYHYQRTGSVEDFLKAFMWAGFVLSVYVLIYYGLDGLQELVNDSGRIGTDFDNPNAIGIALALSATIAFNFLVNGRFNILYAIGFGLSATVNAFAGSRTGFAGLMFGIFAVYLFKCIKEKKIRSFFKFAAFIAIGFLILYYASKLEIFSDFTERIESLFNLFTGEGKVDGSAQTRDEMRKTGIRVFLNNPIVGVGMGNSGYYNVIHTYFHNNYAEMLASGGIIGFAIYYGMHVYIIINLIKYRKYADNNAILIFILVCIFLLTDYGTVSYYRKATLFYFALCFLEIDILKQINVNETAVKYLI